MIYTYLRFSLYTVTLAFDLEVKQVKLTFYSLTDYVGVHSKINFLQFIIILVYIHYDLAL